MTKNYDNLKLKKQICFPLYRATKEVIQAYSVLLDPLDLTYTQYLVMMVLWEYKEISMKELESKLTLDSNTLTPVVKRLEGKGYLKKVKDQEDKRKLNITLLEEGLALRELACDIPMELYLATGLSEEEAKSLCTIVQKAIKNLETFKQQSEDGE